MKDRLHVAVIGAGYWGTKVISEYLESAKKSLNVDLFLVCDLVDRNLKACSEKLGVPGNSLTMDYKEALGSSLVDAVHVCTPNDTHYRICKEALLAGKHVLLEKPMALNAKDAWELVGLAKQKDLILQVGHIFRFNNAMKVMKDLIAENYFGSLYYLKLQWTTLAPSPLKRDIIFDLGPHPIDILNYILKKWPNKVTCKARAYRRAFLEELAYFTLEFEKKLLAQVELSWLQRGKVRQLDVIGSERSACVDCLNQSIQVFENGNEDALSLDVVRNNTILDEISHFALSVKTTQNSRNPGGIGARNVAVLEGLRRSLQENRTMEVDLRVSE